MLTKVCVAGFLSGPCPEKLRQKMPGQPLPKNEPTNRTEMNRYKHLLCLAAAATLTTAAFAQSAPTAPTTSADTGWITSASFGFSLAKGNTDNLLANGNLLTSRKWDRNEVDLGADGTYGETDGLQSAGNIHGFGQYNRLFTEPEKLAAALEEVLGDAALRQRMGQANRDKVKDFAPEPVARHYLEILREITGPAAKSTDSAISSQTA